MCVCNMLETCMDYLVQLEEDQSYTSQSSVGIAAPQALARGGIIPQHLHKTCNSLNGPQCLSSWRTVHAVWGGAQLHLSYEGYLHAVREGTYDCVWVDLLIGIQGILIVSWSWHLIGPGAGFTTHTPCRPAGP